MKSLFSLIEPLESRIAPAFVIVSPTMATFTDVDGDLVTIKSSKPVLDDADFLRSNSGIGQHLDQVVLNDDGTAADGLNLSIIAAPQNGHGDGLVNVGFINASGRLLGTVQVDGDLGAITAGDTSLNSVALKSLTVQSLSQFSFGSSALAGSVGSIVVKGSVGQAYVPITGSVGGVFSSLGALTIGGSFLGGSTSGGGAFNVDGNIGNVKVGGSVIAGSGGSTGQIGSLHGSVGKVTIGGDLIGGPAGFSGYIFAFTSMGDVTIGGDLKGGGTAGGDGDSGLLSTATGKMGKVKIGGSLLGGLSGYCGSIAASSNAGSAGSLSAVTIGRDVIGGSAANTGRISAASDIGPVTIGGSLTGGTSSDSGLIASGGAIGAVKIARDLEGGTQARTGWIHAEENIASFTIGRSVTGGAGDDSGSVATEATLGKVKIGADLHGAAGKRSGRIFAGENMGAVSIVGSMIGDAGDDSGQVALAKFTSGVIHTIGGVTIGGDVIGAVGQFSGSLRVVDTFIDDFDSFGAVKVAGDWKGGSGYHAGSIRGATLTSMTIGGSLIGGSNTFAGGWQMTTTGSITIGGDVIGGSSDETGYVSSHPKTLTIRGSLIGGTAGDSGELVGTASKVVIGHDVRGSVGMTSFGSLTIGGSILTGGGISGILGAITVKGSIIGTAAQDVQIIGRGDTSLTPGLPPWIPLKSLTVGGRVEHALIAVGYSSGAWADPDAQIGAVKVGGDWIASNLLAGIDPSDGQVADGSDIKADLANRDHPELFSKIASVVIGGQVIGDGTTKTYGFGAEEIGSFKVNGIALAVKAGRSNDKFAGAGVAGNAIPVGPSLSNVVSDGFAVHVFEL